MNVYKTKSFKSIQKIWYDKLKASGFEDAEIESDEIISTHRFLKDWHSYYFQKKYANRVDFFLSVQRYYELAFSLLENHCFKTEQDKNVWEQHCNGLSLRKISKITTLKVGKIHNIVCLYRKIMMNER